MSNVDGFGSHPAAMAVKGLAQQQPAHAEAQHIQAQTHVPQLHRQAQQASEAWLPSRGG
ncbi:hypothetical protein ACWCXX_40210 [Streptomyces sp. NPDC001732]